MAEIISEKSLRSFLKEEGCTSIIIVGMSKNDGGEVIALGNNDDKIIAWIEKGIRQGCDPQSLAEKIAKNADTYRVVYWSNSHYDLPCVCRPKAKTETETKTKGIVCCDL
jgi:hypothetical protein